MESANLTNLFWRITTTATTLEDITRNVTNIVARNVSRNATSNAYEWRFILPPYILIFTLSICGNFMVIATLAGNKRMRTVTNVYLLNLAISDFMLGVFCVPFTLVGQIYRRFLFGAPLCKLIPFLQAVSVSVDVWTLVAISLERYFAICRPLKSRKWQTECHAYKMIATVWGLSLTLNSPILLVSTLQPMRGNAYKCREVWPSLELERSFNLGLDATLLIIPVFVMMFAYSLIVSKLWRGMKHEIQHNFIWQRQLSEKSTGKEHLTVSNDVYCKKWPIKKQDAVNGSMSRDGKEMNTKHVPRSTHTDKSIESKRKVIRMLFVIMMMFFICWTPLHVINTIYLFYPEELYQYIGSKGIISLQLLAYCSSFCNPITYCFMNRRFRTHFICLIQNCRLFRCCLEKKAEFKQAAPPPSSQEVTACVVRGSQTARSGDDLFRSTTGFKQTKRYYATFNKTAPHGETHDKGNSWRGRRGRNAFSSGSLANSSSGNHPALPAPAVISRPITQVIETGVEGSEFLYRITWARSGPAKGTAPTQPLYE